MRRLALTVVVLLALAGCTGGSGGSNGGDAPASTSVRITTARVGSLGPILVDGQGRTLYMFAPDKRSKVTCTSQGCLSTWPPVGLSDNAKAEAGGKVRAALLGSMPGPKGKRIVTYNDWPLYRYIADTGPGDVSGQGLDDSGGLWYVMSPSGKPIRR